MAIPGAPAGLLGLKLVAQTRQTPTSSGSAIGVDPATFQIRYPGGPRPPGRPSSFTFSNLKENRRPPDKTLRVPHPQRRGCHQPMTRQAASRVASRPPGRRPCSPSPVPRRAPRAARSTQARAAERSRTTTSRSPSTPRRPARSPTTAPSALGARARQAARVAGSLQRAPGGSPPPASSKRRWSSTSSPPS